MTTKTLRPGPFASEVLRGCGMPDRLIDYLPSPFQAEIQDYSCFIRYSSKDDASPSGCTLGFCRSAFSRLAWPGPDRPASDVILAQDVGRWR